jgi:carbon monoxide dehydrogenase subunit G
MAHVRESVRSPRPQAKVFSYLSDFTTTAEWDPGVKDAEQLTDGPVGVGTRVRVVASFMGRAVELVYEVTEFEPPRRIVLRGENPTTLSIDEIVVDPDGEGCRVSYDANLTLKGPLRLADPLLALVFRRVADRAIGGLRKAIGAHAER